MCTKAEKALKYFEMGYNCSQSVVAAFIEEIDLDFETAMRLSSSFGGGFGRLREVCGAISGMCIVAGVLYGNDSPDDDTAKAEHYSRIQSLADEFKQLNNTIICRELLSSSNVSSSPTPTPRNAEFYKERPCGKFIYEAAEIMDNYIKTHEI